MKTNKTLFVAVLLLCSFQLSAKIDAHKEGKSMIVSFVASPDAVITLDTIKVDYFSAYALALNQKCNNLLFKDKNGSFFQIINSKEELSFPESHWNKLVDEINAMTESKVGDGTKVGTKKVMVSGAKYKSDTFINGKLDSTYESDWDQGYFAPSTSKYVSGGDTYITKTYYVAPKYRMVDEYAYGKATVKPGLDIFIEKTYVRK